MKKSSSTIIVIEPSDIVLRGLCDLLREVPEVSVVGVYHDLSRYQSQPQASQQADIIIINPTQVSYGRRGTIKNLFPDMHVVALLYSYLDKETLHQFDEVIEVYDRPSRIAMKLERVMEQSAQSDTQGDTEELTEREKEILVAVAKGMMNKEIADHHCISIHTVISHRKNISRKTGIKSVSGFVVYALLNNLIEERDIR